MTAEVSSAPRDQATRTAARILVADDSATNVFVLTAMLRSLGFPTLSAADGAEAVDVAMMHRPTLIFMDVQMPRLDGISAAMRIREALPDRHVAIVAVTAHPDVRHQASFKAAGFDDVMVKPVELALVRQAVRRWMPGADANADPDRKSSRDGGPGET